MLRQKTREDSATHRSDGMHSLTSGDFYTTAEAHFGREESRPTKQTAYALGKELHSHSREIHSKTSQMREKTALRSRESVRSRDTTSKPDNPHRLTTFNQSDKLRNNSRHVTPSKHAVACDDGSSVNQSSISGSGFYQPKNTGARLRQIIDSCKAEEPAKREGSFLAMMKKQLHKQKSMLGVETELQGTSKPATNFKHPTGLEKLKSSKNRATGLSHFSYLATSPSSSFHLLPEASSPSHKKERSPPPWQPLDTPSTSPSHVNTNSSLPTHQSAESVNVKLLLLEHNSLLATLDELKHSLRLETREREFWRRKTLEMELLLDRTLREEIDTELDRNKGGSPRESSNWQQGELSLTVNAESGSRRKSAGQKGKGLMARLTELARNQQVPPDKTVHPDPNHARNFSFFGGE